jgi:D-3-phosphoglycerate dehydrogenase
MRAIAYDPYITTEVAASFGVELRDSVEEVLRESDFVSLHTPLTPATRHMIGKDQLAMMKPTAYLINCSRGEVVDEAALIEALRSGVIAGAGLDVFEQEPPAPDNPLLTMDNVVLTPHSSSLTLNGKIKMATIAVEQLLKVLRGEQPDYLVNRDVIPANTK